MTYVLAGTYAQARDWAGEHGVSGLQWSYITGPEALYGVSRPRVLRIGTWYMRNDLRAVEAEMRLRRAVEVVE